METWLSKILHTQVLITDDLNIEILPLYLKNTYDYLCLNVYEHNFLIVRVKGKTNLTLIKKHVFQLYKITGLKVIVLLEKMNQYQYTKLIEEGISFIVNEKQLYLPFLGLMLTDNNDRLIKKCNKLSRLTNRFLILSIYHHWKKINITQASKELEVTKMSMTRCFDELEALELSLIEKKGNSRYFVWNYSSFDLWKLINCYMESPVYKEYRLSEIINCEDYKLSGISALSHYTMLNDNSYPTIAITKTVAKKYELEKIACVPDDELPKMVVQVLYYHIPYEDGKAIDPISSILSIEKNDKEDPRVSKAIDELLCKI